MEGTKLEPKPGEVVVVSTIPACNFCQDGTPGPYDFTTKHGPWANGCEAHWVEHRASADLGIGKGQRWVTADQIDQPTETTRYAVVSNARDREQVARYLPGNYEVVGASPLDPKEFVIAGHDDAGWTLDDYVIPRFASGFWDDAEVISVYTRRQAVEDGTLVSLDEEPLIAEAGFNCSVALTRGLFELVTPTEAERERYGQSYTGRLWDVLNMARMYSRAARERDTAGEGDVFFPCIFTICGRDDVTTKSGRRFTGQKTYKLWFSLAPGDDGEPSSLSASPGSADADRRAGHRAARRRGDDPSAEPLAGASLPTSETVRRPRSLRRTSGCSLRGRTSVLLTNLFCFDPEAERIDYQSVEAILADGWRVD